VTSPALGDRELVRRCLEGNQAAFRELHHRHVDRVHRLVARVLGPGADCFDVVQEVFLEVHRSLDRFRGEAAFTTWLHRLTIHVAISALRRRKPAPLALVGDGPSRGPERPGNAAVGQDPVRRLEARDDLRALYRALDHLAVHNRVAFVLFELEGMSLEELAATMNVPLHTAAARLRRARLALTRAVYEGEAEAPGRKAVES